MDERKRQARGFHEGSRIPPEGRPRIILIIMPLA